MTWIVGDRVKTNLEHAWTYSGSTWAEKMGTPREGTVIEVPMATRETGHGTLLVRWDSLTGCDNSKDDLWVRWNHSDLIDRV